MDSRSEIRRQSAVGTERFKGDRIRFDSLWGRLCLFRACEKGLIHYSLVLSQANRPSRSMEIRDDHAHITTQLLLGKLCYD